MSALSSYKSQIHLLRQIYEASYYTSRAEELGDPHLGIDAMLDGNAGNGSAGLQAFLDNLGFERLGVRASLAYLRAIASA